MTHRFFQANLNHARGAQDLFVQSFAKRSYGLRVAAEPCRVPIDDPRWFSFLP